MTTLANKPDFTSDDLIEGSSLHTITKAREDAYNRGIAEGLRRAAEIVDAPFGDNPERQHFAKRLREQADAVEREAK